MERILTAVVCVVAIFIVSFGAALVRRLLEWLNTKIQDSEVAKRYAFFVPALAEAASRAVSQIEANFVQNAKKASSTGTLSYSEGITALDTAIEIVKRQMAAIDTSLFMDDDQIAAAVEHALLKLGLNSAGRASGAVNLNVTAPAPPPSDK